jgi:predicted ATPase/DNA-binding XRE family transcriptional regulator
MKSSVEERPHFGRLLRDFRVAAGLSQEALAERASMSVNGISALERGANQAPQRETLELLIRGLSLNDEQAQTLTRAAVRKSVPRERVKRARGNTALPYVATPFVGRRRDVADVTELLRASPLVTLTGPGGIGKTRLALKIAEELESSFRDGVRFVDLAPLRDPELVACAVGGRFGIKECVSESILQTIAREAREKQALVVVDNCEHLLAPAAGVIDALVRSCPHVRIVATSRQPLNVSGEYLYHVDSLDVIAAVELFADRANRVTGSFSVNDGNYAAVSRIVTHLDRIALAIELAAARVNVLTLDQLEARLSQRFQLLTGGSAQQPRQQTMRAAIDWSYDLLDDDERRLFRRLWVFSNGFSLDAALRVCEDNAGDEATTFESLSCLVNKSLIVVDDCDSTHRFRLLETLRVYAAEKVDESGETAALHRRHAQYFASLAETADCDFGSSESTNAWIRALEPDLENFRAALQWSLGEHGDTSLAVELITKLQEFWIAQGFAKDIGRRARAVLLAHAGLSDSQCAGLWLTLARMRQELFVHPGEMLEAARRARDLYERAGDRAGLAMALRQYGTALMRLGEFQQAEAELRHSIDLYRQLADHRMIVRGLGYLATLLQMRGDYAQARTALTDVLQMAGEIGDDRMVPTTAMNLAETEFALGDSESAARRAQENLANETLQKSPEMKATQSANLAVYLFALGKTDESRNAALEAIRSGSGSFVAVPLQHLAATIVESDPKRAARILGYVESVFTTTAFARQYSEDYTYRSLIETLRRRLGAEDMKAYMREGAEMNEKYAVALATQAPAKNM